MLKRKLRGCCWFWRIPVKRLCMWKNYHWESINDDNALLDIKWSTQSGKISLVFKSERHACRTTWQNQSILCNVLSDLQSIYQWNVCESSALRGQQRYKNKRNTVFCLIWKNCLLKKCQCFLRSARSHLARLYCWRGYKIMVQYAPRYTWE